MLKSRFIKPLTRAAMLSVLPVLALSLAHAQDGATPAPPPPGPYTALPDLAQMRAAPQMPATPASQVWRAPQGQVLPYWMRAASGTSAPVSQNGAGVTPQYLPTGQAAAAARIAGPAGSVGSNGGFFSSFGQPNAGFYQGNQGYVNQGYPAYPPQMPQMPYWGGQPAPYYPGFQPTYPAYGQYNR